MRAFKFLILLVMTVGIAACGSDVEFGIANKGETFKQGAGIFSNQLDILWVVDNSGSMAPFQTNLAANFSASITGFQAKGYDFRIAVTATDAYTAAPNFGGVTANAKFKDGIDSIGHTGIFLITPTTPNLVNVFVKNAQTGTLGQGDERAFQSFQEALTNPVNAGFNFLRPQSFLAVIILSDEDDFSSSRGTGQPADHDYNDPRLHPVDNYITFLDQLTQSTGAFRRFNVSAIAATDPACVAQTQSKITATRYKDLVTKTKGVLGSICDASFANALQAISNQIAVLSTQFYLAKKPRPDSIQVIVNGQVIPADPTNGWTYDVDANSIQFHGVSTPPQGATIQVNYIPTTINF